MKNIHNVVYRITFDISTFIPDIYEKGIIKNLNLLEPIDSEINYDNGLQKLTITMISFKNRNTDEFINSAYKNLIKEFNKRFGFKLYDVIYKEDYTKKTINFICKKQSSFIGLFKFLAIDKLFNFKNLRSFNLKFTKHCNNFYFNNEVLVDTFRNNILISEEKKDYHGNKISILTIKIYYDNENLESMSINFIKNEYLLFSFGKDYTKTNYIKIFDGNKYLEYLNNPYTEILKEKMLNFILKNLKDFIRYKITMEDKLFRKIKNEISNLKLINLIV